MGAESGKLGPRGGPDQGSPTLAIDHPAPDPPALPAHQVLGGLATSLAYFLGHPVVQAKRGGGAGPQRAASGLVGQVVWLIRKHVCMCVPAAGLRMEGPCPVSAFP